MPALYMIQGGIDAAGQAANKIEDASAGMTKATDTAGNMWAWNGRAGQWQRLVVMKGDGTTILSTLAQKFYGSAGAWHQIADLPENTPIVSTSGTKAIPGDVLLIPNLTQPWTPPTATGGGTDVGPTEDIPSTVAGIPGVLPGLGDPPPGWPSGLPWPGTNGGTPDGTTPAITGDTPPPGGTDGDQPVEIVPAGSTTTASLATTTKEEKFWTTPKIVIAGVLGVGIVGTVIYFATRGPSRRRARRRRR